jgi:serine/threonine protein kinase
MLTRPQYAMLAGYLPFDDDPANPEGDNINLLYKYIVSTPLTFPEYVTPHARDLLKRILVPDPRKRADLFEVARHSWLSEYAHVVGFITSSTTTPNDIANATVPSGRFSLLLEILYISMLTLSQKTLMSHPILPAVPLCANPLRRRRTTLFQHLEASPRNQDRSTKSRRLRETPNAGQFKLNMWLPTPLQPVVTVALLLQLRPQQQQQQLRSRLVRGAEAKVLWKCLLPMVTTLLQDNAQQQAKPQCHHQLLDLVGISNGLLPTWLVLRSSQ